MRALVAVCCYNTAESARRLLAKFPAERPYDVVVIDDGSTDGTPEILKEFPFEVITHPRNRGVGAAIKTGIRHALDHGYEVFSLMAGNDKDDPRDIPRLLAAIEAGADYVQGSRFAPGGSHPNTPPFRQLMVPMHAFFVRLMTGFKGTDALNGFRAYRLSIFADPRIDIWQDWLDAYQFETYLHYKVITTGKRVVEVGVSKTYPPPAKRGKYSHIRPGIDWWRILQPLFLLKLRLRK